MTVEKTLPAKSIIEFTFWRKYYQFNPRPLATLATVVLFPLLILLGFWQLHRADIKKEILALYHTNSLILPTTTQTKLTEPLPKEFQKISLRGHYVSSHILWDNRFHTHQAGFEVLTPFKLADSNYYLLVNRGWIPRHRNRTIAPTFNTPSEKKEIVLKGYVHYPSQGNLLLGPNTETLKSGMIIAQNIEIDPLSDVLQRPLYPFVLHLDEKEENGFTRSWSPVTMTPDIHLGYAVQWFALAASLLIIYLVVNLKSEKKP